MTRRHTPKNLFKDVFAMVNDAMINFRYLTAASKLKTLLQKYPGEEQWWCYLGMLYDHLALRQKAQKLRQRYQTLATKACSEALKINPDAACAYEGLGRIYWHNSDRKAIYYYKKAYSIAKRQFGKWNYNAMNLANVYFELGEYKQAEKLYLNYAKQSPHFGIFNALTELYVITIKPAKARHYLKLAKKALGREKRFYPDGSKARQVAIKNLARFEKEISRLTRPDRP